MATRRADRWHAVAGLALLVLAAGCGSEHATDNQHPVVARGREYPVEERLFNTAAIHYLTALVESDRAVAEVRVGAAKGTSTLDQVHRAILNSRANQDRLWSGFELVPVPKQLASMRDDFARCRQLHQQVFRECLAYWVDGDLGHIESGNDLYMQAARMTNQCLDALKASAGPS
jgi:hypothetical protein